MLILILIFIAFIIIAIVGLIKYNNRKATEESPVAELTKLGDDARLHFSSELLKFIDDLITVEINNAVKTEILTGEKINIRIADDAVRDIAKTVYEALDSRVISENGETILNPTYIMTYITRRSLLMYTTFAVEFNKSIVD